MILFLKSEKRIAFNKFNYCQIQKPIAFKWFDCCKGTPMVSKIPLIKSNKTYYVLSFAALKILNFFGFSTSEF